MWWDSLLQFLLPVCCPVCESRSPASASPLCLNCEWDLPRASFTDLTCNPVARLFWGRVPVDDAVSLLRFEKGSPYRKMMHSLKYEGNRRLGVYLGTVLGYCLRDSNILPSDALVPVPLHRRKERGRGYNQAELIAMGISGVTGIPVRQGLLERRKGGVSQTGLDRYGRFENVADRFCVPGGAPEVNANRILLVDDVITTGSTLEACILSLRRHYACRVSVATVAFA